MLAVSSAGVIDIARLAAPHLAGIRAVLLTSKGFAPDHEGRIILLPQAVEAQLATPLPIVAVGGPCKANEVAARRPTASHLRRPPRTPRAGHGSPPPTPTASPTPPTATASSCAPR